ncbi:hypothetical protein H5410_050127 [Solanum commersonii]|uniref:Uncharacterized protein n=1 Tax=Solanum commersonii TaxID=4109 RepID=A0A9J5WWP5_SOLCO|nr:hypothetical protein H5410_050127 [Solanum commersonii]
MDSPAWRCEKLAMDGFRKGGCWMKKYWGEVIRQDMTQLQLTEGMTLNRQSCRTRIRVEVEAIRGSQSALHLYAYRRKACLTHEVLRRRGIQLTSRYSVGHSKEYQGPSMVLEQYEIKEQKDVVEENGPSMYLVDSVRREPVDVLRVEVVPNEELS